MLNFLQLVISPPDGSLLYVGHYDPVLVILSVGIAVLASYTSFMVAQFVAAGGTPAKRRLWTLVGGLCMGAGVWAMHFTGMLAFSLPCATTYDPAITLFSMIPAVLACSLAVYTISREEISRAQLLVGGLLIGAGIGTMHYSGMAAYRFNGLIRYDLKLFLVSLLTAFVLATLALWVRFQLRSWQVRWRSFAALAGAVVMGLAVSAMHYTAMAAAYFIRGDISVSHSQLAPSFLAFAVLAVTSSIILITLAATFLDRPGVYSLASVFRSMVILIVGWGVVAWLGSSYHGADLAEQSHRQGLGRAGQQAADVREEVGEALLMLQGIPEALAADETVQAALRRFGPEALPSPVAPEERRRRWTSDGALAKLDAFLATAATSLNADVVWVINAAGDCVAASNAGKPTSFVGTNYADRQYFLQARAGQRGQQYAVGRITKVPGLYRAYPVTDQGRFIGAVVAKRDLSAFLHYTRQANVLVVDANGVIVLANDKNFEGRTVPGAIVANLPEPDRLRQYGRSDFPALDIRPWQNGKYADVVLLGADPEPHVLVSEALTGSDVAIYVPGAMPELVRIEAERPWIFVVAFIAGSMLIVAVATLVLNARATRRARDVAIEAEVQAREQRNFLTAILENEPECVKVVAPDGTLLQMNGAGLAMLEVDSVEEINAEGGVASFILPAYRPAYLDLMERVAAGGSGMQEFPLEGKHGTRRWLETRAAPLRDAAGNVTHLLGVTRDVTRKREAEEELKEREQRFRSVLETAPDAIILADDTGTIIGWNKGAQRIFGYGEAEVVGVALDVLMPERHREPHRTGLGRYRAGGEPPLKGRTVAIEALHKNGNEFPVELTLGSWQAGATRYFSAIIRDITDRKQHEAEIARLSQWNELLLNSAGEGIYGVDREGRCTFINPAALTILGFRRDEVLGIKQHPLFHHHHTDGSPYPEEECPIHLTLCDGVRREVEDAFIRKNGEVFPVQLTVTPMQENGRLVGVEVVFQDIARRKAMEQELIRLANTDSLTGVANRRRFLEQLEMELARIKRFGKPATFLMLDLDHFKNINDTYGHATGDAVLQHFAEQSRLRLRRIDLLGRLGGEEFGILLPGTDSAGALEFAERFRRHVADTPVPSSNGPIRFTVSIGVAEFDPGDSAPDSILSRADVALYRAKEGGRNRVEVS